MQSPDTIFAPATAPGKSGVAIIRLSGPQAPAALQRLTGMAAITPRQAYFTAFRDPSGAVIDQGLALYFPAPHSFTGEDVVELQLHGSMAVIQEMLALLASLPGLRPAEPGEFSRRAFTNGKMDLLEAEALADLIDAETPKQKAQAQRQMQGELSGYYENLRRRVIQSLALLEAYIDFPDEEIPESVLTSLREEIVGLQTTIAKALSDDKRGQRLREGVNIVILGAPNAGKSSLLNTLARRDVAIVSHQAGTTRDMIEVHLQLAGYPVILVDTAGLRESDDVIEAEGIRRARSRAQEADIKLILADGKDWPDISAEARGLTNDNSLLLITKSDLVAAGKRYGEALFISTQSGEGIEALLAALEAKIIEFFSGHEAPYITRSRHRALLSEALEHLSRVGRDAPLELKCEELRRAALSIGKITGKINVDDVLDVIFRQFCIGK